MCISKKARKLMTFVLCFVFILTSFSSVPKKAHAATEPTVDVLGGTLRLDAAAGSQSLRVGIKVSHASKAKACGIEITAKGKTVKLATDGDGDTVEKHEDLYSVDEATDTIIYTAVITNIPKDYFGLQFSVKGSVTWLDEASTVATSGEATQRSVSDVVAALQQKDPTITMSDEGVLMKGDAPLTKDDNVFNGGMSEAPVPTPDATTVEGWERVDLSKANLNENVTYDSQRESLSIKNVNAVDIPIFNSSESLPIGTKISLRIRGYNNTGKRFRYWVGGASKARVSDEAFCETTIGNFDTEAKTFTTKEIADNANANGKFNAISLKVPSYDSDWNLDHIITGIWYKVEALPTPTPTIDPSVTAPPVYKVDLKEDAKFDSAPPSTITTTKDGEEQFTFENTFSGLYYILPNTTEMAVSNYKSVYITYTNTAKSISVYLPTVEEGVITSEEIASGHPLEGNQENTKKMQTEKLSPTENTKTIMYSSSSVAIRGIQLFNHLFSGGGETTLTIKSIIFSEKELTADELAAVQKDGVLP